METIKKIIREELKCRIGWMYIAVLVEDNGIEVLTALKEMKRAGEVRLTAAGELGSHAKELGMTIEAFKAASIVGER